MYGKTSVEYTEELQSKFPEQTLKPNQKESQRYFLGVLEGCP